MAGDTMERIRSEAATHPSDCSCLTCRAASGDEQAKKTLLRELI